MSEICESFGCTPKEALEQDIQLVRAVLDWRNSRYAVEVFNGADRAKAFDELAESPVLVRALAYMNRAQRGAPLEGDPDSMKAEALAIAEEYRVEKEGEPDGC